MQKSKNDKLKLDADSGLVGQIREVGHGDSCWSCRLTAEDRKYQNHMCVTDTQGMHRRIGYSHHRFVLMSQSRGNIAMAMSPVCTAHTFWALLMWLPYILVTWSDFTMWMSHTSSNVTCFLLHWFMTVLRSIFRRERARFIVIVFVCVGTVVCMCERETDGACESFVASHPHWWGQCVSVT